MNALPLFGATPDVLLFPPPRPFQDLAHKKLREGMRAGHRKQLLVAPTGAGKTYIGLRIARETMSKGRKALFVCDRTALINQTSERADYYGMTNHGIVQANHWRRDNAQPFQIASIQTIAARGFWPEADVIIIDEAHTQHSAWVEYLKTTQAAVVGLTATPCSKGLGLSFSNMVNAATMDELTQQGVLVPMRILSCTTPDMTGAAMAGGEWTSKAASECETQIIGDVVMEWHKHANGKKTIAFGADIAYCQELAKRFKENGVRAECFTSETHALEREILLEDFEGPDCKIRILISVEALAKGFDVQDIECVIDARPLRKSLSTAIQMWGRGLRSSPQTGKSECLLLDHSNNIRRFYDDFTDIYFNGFKTLDDGEKMDSVARKELDYEPAGCPQCHATPFRRKCLKCGHEKVTQSLETEAAGEMEEIRIGKKVVAADRHDLWQQLCGYAKGAKNPQGRASHLYRAFVGDWPPRQWHIDFTEPAPITKGTLNKIRSLNIAFHKAKEQSPTSML